MLGQRFCNISKLARDNRLFRVPLHMAPSDQLSPERHFNVTSTSNNPLDPIAANDEIRQIPIEEILRGDTPAASQIFLHILNLSTCHPIRSITERLWQKAQHRCVVDGGANYVHDMLANCHLPELITGDMDSIAPHLLQLYRANSMVDVVPTPDEDETDYVKSLRCVAQRCTIGATSTIVTLMSDNGRFDHIMGNLNALYSVGSIFASPVPTVLHVAFADQLEAKTIQLQMVLQPGRSRLMVGEAAIGHTCGLIPLGSPCMHVTTAGLKWNLSDQELRFGVTISTSNIVEKAVVDIFTDSTLLWTCIYPLPG